VGVVGIGAATVAERYGRPAILLALRGDGTAKGSGRSVEGIDILDAVRGAAGDLMLGGGGHAFAVGVTVREQDVTEFARRVAAACAARSGDVAGPVLRYDAEASAEEMTAPAVAALDILRPYGRGNPAPAFLVRAARPVAPPALFGSARNHLEFFLPGGARAVWWQGAPHAGRVRQGVPMDLVVRPSVDAFRGIKRVQLEVEDVREPAR
jgi:single-stranded-DNA-specific exonuclease